MSVAHDHSSPAIKLEIQRHGSVSRFRIGVVVSKDGNAVGLTLILSRRHFVLLFRNVFCIRQFLVCRQYTDVCAVVSGARLLSYLELYMSLLHVQPTHCTLSGIVVIYYDTTRYEVLF